MIKKGSKGTKVEGLTVKNGRLINEQKGEPMAPITQAAIDRKKYFKSKGMEMPEQPGC